MSLPPSGERTRRLVMVLAVLLTVAIGPFAAAQTPTEDMAALGITIPTNPANAATWYLRAIDELAAVDPRDREIVGNWDRSLAPTRSVRLSLRAHAAVLDDAAAGASRSWCDFEVRYDQGWELLLPHLQPLRSIVRVLAARAAVAINDGRPEAATRDIERMLRIGQHVSGDDIYLSSLISMAVVSLADELVDTGFRRGVFGPVEAAMLLDIIKELATPGAFRLRAVLAAERQVFGGWLREQLVGSSPDERLAFFTEMLGGEPDDEETGLIVAATSGEFEPQLRGMDQAYAEADEAFARAQADPESGADELAAWEERLIDGEFGELAVTFMPSITLMAARDQQMRQSLVAREAMLRGIIAGDPSARRLDAAVHLREAIRAAAGIPGEALDLIAMGAGVLDAAVDGSAEPEGEASTDVGADAAAVRAALQTVLEQLAAAAGADHFDAAVLHAEGDSIVLPAWAGGARRVLRLLAGEATRHLDAGDHARALRLVAVGLRVSRHLASSGVLAMSPIVQEHAAQLVPLVWGLPDALREDAAGWAPLVAAAEAIVSQPRFDQERRQWTHREDALLGYTNALGRLRSIAGQAAGDLRARVAGETSDWECSDSQARTLDGDMVVMLVLATERVAGAVYEPAAPPVPASDEEAADPDRLPRVPGLDGIVDVAGLIALEQRVAAMRRAIVAKDDPLALIAGPEPSPLNVRVRQREARRLIRELHRAVDPTREWEIKPVAQDSPDGA